MLPKGRDREHLSVTLYDTGAHRRHNPLTGRWVLVAPGRLQRPWQGEVQQRQELASLRYDPKCYLCPGNARVGGERNPEYNGTFAFTNDFPALVPNRSEMTLKPHALVQSEEVSGTCRVLCWSPRHDKTLATGTVEETIDVINLWVDQVRELSSTFRWVQIFENRGEQMGASNPHPHGQVWASNSLPTEATLEDDAQRSYFRQTGETMLEEYLLYELENRDRIVVEGEGWVALVPFWATWPFETILMPKTRLGHLPEMDPACVKDLATVLNDLLTRYDNLFGIPFPYSMGWHGSPAGNGATEHWQLHAHFYPPLMTPDLRKFMVGYEMLAESQRDLTAEEAASLLRGAGTVQLLEEDQ